MKNVALLFLALGHAAAGAAVPEGATRDVASPPTEVLSSAIAVPPVTDAMLRQPADGDWLMWRRTYNSWGYSPLKQVSRSNVSNLSLIWSRPLAPGMQEGTPLAYHGLLVMPEPRNVIRAYDAKNGDLLWEYKRPLPADLGKTQPMADQNRAIAIYQNLVIGTSADDFIFAIDVRTGKLVWETVVNDYRTLPGMQSGGPIVVDGLVISGRACWPKAGPDACVLVANDARTGKEVWRTSTIARPGDPNSKTWGNVALENRRHVGTWMPPSYDSKSNLVYFGTSVTSPAPKFLMSGDDKTYLYHNSTLALDPKTGRIVWYYQHAVDHWDLDSTFERMIVDVPVSPDTKEVNWVGAGLKTGKPTTVVTGIPGKNGIIFTLDARSGRFLWAKPTIFQNVVSGIDTKGKVSLNPESLFHQKGDERLICPGWHGGKNWPAGAFDPESGTMYFPLQQNTCQQMTVTIAKADPAGQLYGLEVRSIPTPPTTQIGSVQAYSASTGHKLWSYQQRAGTLSLVATGGGLLFGGDQNGRFRAFDSRTGAVLWEVNLGAPVTGYPIVFSVAGRQYVAASTGRSITTAGINISTPELKPGSANTLFVFALPEATATATEATPVGARSQ